MSRRFLVGTYTSVQYLARSSTGKPRRVARGLYLCEMDERGRIAILDVCGVGDPSFVAVHPRQPLAYAVGEAPDGEGALSIVALGADRLTLRDRWPSGGRQPCHVALAAGGIVIAHYGCGTIAYFALDEAGLPTGAPRTWRHAGSSAHPKRQASAHPHCVLVSDGAAYVTDLGQDCIVRYAGDPLIETMRCAIHAGAGPRHLVIDRGRRVGWLANELDNTVSRLALGEDGALTELDWTTTLPRGFEGRSAVSEIALHPNGRTLYVGNRGHDSIAWFDVGAAGALAWRGVVSTQGRHPRHFALTSDGRAMLVANRDSDLLVPFAFNASGAPQPMGYPFCEIPAPVCVRWL